MPTSPIIIISGSGGGGNQTNVEYDHPYSVVAGDSIQNTLTGAVDLNFTGVSTGFQVIPLPGLSGLEVEEAGSFTVTQ